jgi:hypothetical protein
MGIEIIKIPFESAWLYDNPLASWTDIVTQHAHQCYAEL